MTVSHKFATQFGQFGQSVFAKVRMIEKSGEHKVSLLPLNTQRHFLDLKIVKEADVPFEDKVPHLVWRGSTTGQGLRERFVHELSHAGHNVKFHKAVQGKEHWINGSTMLGKPFSLKQILRYRYVLSLEGNDVASNLRTIMASQSVVLMPIPTKETWFRQGIIIIILIIMRST